MRDIKAIIFFLSLILSAELTSAQNNLGRNVSIGRKQTRLSDFLTELGKKGNFYFSYSSEQIRADSLIDISATNKTIRTVLDEIFNGNVDYKESPGYIILRPAPNRLSLLPDTTTGEENSYEISGYVIDDRTGLGIPNASVYEKRLLVSTLTNNKGFFNIKIKNEGQITLTVSKEYYKDASVNFLNNVTISLKHHPTYYSANAAAGNTERNWLGRIFISSRQKMQSLNLGGFMADVPFQTSFIPGLSTHGMMSSQVINHYSINLLGGYTAGLDGIELGGLFNLNKQDVKYLQAAGLFNVVGGNFEGIQLAGISNTVLKNAHGLQAAGIYNTAKEVKGVQLAGIFNQSKVMKGVSISVVNLTDTLDGYAIGLLNLSKNGYHQVMVYNNEITTVNVGFKTGNAKLYTVLSAGVNFANSVKLYGFSIGVGHDFILNSHYILSTEIATQSLQTGNWDHQYQINKLSTLVHFKAATKIGIFAGPSFNVYHQQKSDDLSTGNQQIISNKIGFSNLGHGNAGWIGWSAGITF